MEFTYHLPVNLMFGRKVVEKIGLEAAKYGRKALIVTGSGSARKTGLLQRVTDNLQAAGVERVVFDRVEPNPLTTTAYTGAALAREAGCDTVIGLGGGSAMDAAKAIAFSTLNPGDISEYIFGQKQSDKALPILLIPTTCGTGSEGNGFAVLTNPENGDKKSLRCNAIIAKASLIDPELMMTMPKPVLASVGFDALCHNMEAYLSKKAQPITDMMALEGMRLSAKYLPRVYDDPADTEAWEQITWASTLGGMVINTAGVVGPHSMEHPASGLRNIVHGMGLAALTPVIVEASIADAPEKYAVISRILGGRDEHDCADRIRALLARLHLNVTLGDLGVTEADVDWMVQNCERVSAAGMAGHPAAFTCEDMARIYRKAL